MGELRNRLSSWDYQKSIRIILEYLSPVTRFLCFSGISGVIWHIWLFRDRLFPCGPLLHGIELALDFKTAPPFSFRILAPLIGQLPLSLGESLSNSLQKILPQIPAWKSSIAALGCQNVYPQVVNSPLF